MSTLFVIKICLETVLDLWVPLEGRHYTRAAACTVCMKMEGKETHSGVVAL